MKPSATKDTALTGARTGIVPRYWDEDVRFEPLKNRNLRVVTSGERRRPIETHTVAWMRKLLGPYGVHRTTHDCQLVRVIGPEEIVEQTLGDLREAASFVPVISHEAERAPESLLASTLERLRDPFECFLGCIQ